jgi:hypothetical protein
MREVTDTDSCWEHCERRAAPKKRPLTAVEVSTTALTGAELVDGFRTVEARVQECRPANGRPDPISVRATITKEGRVSVVTVQPQSALATVIPCVESAVKGAHFRTSPGLRADYVFVFRQINGAGAHAPPDGGVDSQ